MSFNSKIHPCLWFDRNGLEAAKFYTSIFANSSIGHISYYTDVKQEITGGTPGEVLTVDFTLNGTRFTALNGGPIFKFSEAVSFQIECQTQEEVDYYWEKLGEGGDESKRQCGWLGDKFGLSWQVVPLKLLELLQSSDPGVVKRVTSAMMDMKKLEIDGLVKAAESKE